MHIICYRGTRRAIRRALGVGIMLAIGACWLYVARNRRRTAREGDRAESGQASAEAEATGGGARCGR